MDMIEDGVGQGYKAKVDNLNRLHTHGTTRSEEEFGAIKGQTYNVNTSTISLTSASESAVFYCKNYKGVEGDTFTDGDVAYRSLLSGAARTYVINTGNIVLTRGTSIGIKITPQTSNTAMDVQLFLSVLSSENIDS